jgi:hypothetical protein
MTLPERRQVIPSRVLSSRLVYIERSRNTVEGQPPQNTLTSQWVFSFVAQPLDISISAFPLFALSPEKKIGRMPLYTSKANWRSNRG